MTTKSKINQTLIQISLFTLSTYMSILMFMHIADSIESKIAMGLVAFIIEYTKQTDLRKLTSMPKVKKSYVISFSLKTFLSVVASLGLILNLLAAQDFRAEAKKSFSSISTDVLNDDIDYWKNEISKLDSTIQLLNENIDRLPEGYGLAGKSFVNQIKDLQDLKVEYKNNLDLAVKNKVKMLKDTSKDTLEVNPTDMFTEISSIVNVDDKFLRLIVFSMIVLLIELSLAQTTVSMIKSSKTLFTTMQNAPQKDNNSLKYSHKGLPLGLNLSSKAIKSSLAVAKKQAYCEQKGLRLHTQKMLANELNTTPVNINNITRRYIKPMMDELQISSYTELSRFLKDSFLKDVS